MSSVDVYEAALRVLERYGFGFVLCTVVLWFARTDIILPMVAAHQEFLHEIAITQREITTAVREQTRLLHEMRHEQDLTAIPEASGSAVN